MAKKKKSEEKIQIDLSINILDMMVLYIFSNNSSVTKKSMVKMRELFKVIDDSVYETDRAMEVRIYLLKTLLRNKIDKRISDSAILAESVLTGGQYDEEIKDIFAEVDDTPDLSDDDVTFIDEYISHRLTYGYIYKYINPIDDTLLQLKTGDFNSLEEINSEFEEILAELYGNMLKSKSLSKYAARDFGSDHESLDMAISHTVTNLNKDKNVIQTGIKSLNKMLNGGYHAGRVYVYLAMPKNWKSGLLLNSAIWGKKYNQELQTSDPTKDPCILYVTQENSIDETIERLWSHYFGDESNIAEHTPDEALKLIEEAGFNQDGIVIKIKWRPNKSINTADLDAMIDDLAIEGYEVVMLVHDYIKRIRSTEKHTELRLELAAIVDEFTVIAKTRQIPVVTATQLNRNAFHMAESAAQSNKTDIGRNFGTSQIGESAAMVENADYMLSINIERSDLHNKNFLTVKLLVGRGKESPLIYFAHPFENGMKLEEDINLTKSLSLESIGDGLSNFDINGSNSSGKDLSPKVTKINKSTRKRRQTISSASDGNLQLDL